MNAKRDTLNRKTIVDPDLYDVFFKEVFRDFFLNPSDKDAIKNPKYSPKNLDLKSHSLDSLEALYKDIGELIEKKKQEPIYEVTVIYPDSSYDKPFTTKSLDKIEEKFPKNFKEIKIVKRTEGSTVQV